MTGGVTERDRVDALRRLGVGGLIAGPGGDPVGRAARSSDGFEWSEGQSARRIEPDRGVR